MSEANKGKKKRQNEEEDNSRAPKRLRGGPEAPDVVLVFGGKEVQEHSRDLCCWSDYFHGAFRSGMKEAQIRRFEFPHRDSDEWA